MLRKFFNKQFTARERLRFSGEIYAVYGDVNTIKVVNCGCNNISIEKYFKEIKYSLLTSSASATYCHCSWVPNYKTISKNDWIDCEIQGFAIFPNVRVYTNNYLKCFCAGLTFCWSCLSNNATMRFYIKILIFCICFAITAPVTSFVLFETLRYIDSAF